MRFFLGLNTAEFCFLYTGKDTVVIDKNKLQLLKIHRNSTVFNIINFMGLDINQYKSMVFDVKLLAGIVYLKDSVVTVGEQFGCLYKYLGEYSLTYWNMLKEREFSKIFMNF